MIKTYATNEINWSKIIHFYLKLFKNQYKTKKLSNVPNDNAKNVSRESWRTLTNALCKIYIYCVLQLYREWCTACNNYFWIRLFTGLQWNACWIVVTTTPHSLYFFIGFFSQLGPLELHDLLFGFSVSIRENWKNPVKSRKNTNKAAMKHDGNTPLSGIIMRADTKGIRFHNTGQKSDLLHNYFWVSFTFVPCHLGHLKSKQYI